MSFDSLGLAEPLLRAVHEAGYTTPTPIQAQAIPAVLSGGDVMGGAQTGTGKTAGFVNGTQQRLGQAEGIERHRGVLLIHRPAARLCERQSKADGGGESEATASTLTGKLGDASLHCNPASTWRTRCAAVDCVTSGEAAPRFGPKFYHWPMSIRSGA